MREEVSIQTEIKRRFFTAIRFVIADLDRYGLRNKSELCEKIGWKIQSMSRAEKKDNFNVPDAYKVKLILLFDIDADWLMTGRGEMRVNKGILKNTVVHKTVHKKVGTRV